MHMGQLDVAQEYFALLLTERPDYCPDLLQSIGETYMGLGLPQEACPLQGLGVQKEVSAEAFHIESGSKALSRDG